MVNDIALRLLVEWNAFQARLRDDDGQTLAEYGLIMAVIAVAVIVLAGIAFREAIAGALNDTTECINGAGDTGPCA